MEHSYFAFAEVLLVLILIVQVWWLVSVLFAVSVSSTFSECESKERRKFFWYSFKYYARMPWYQIWVFFIGGDLKPSLYYRIKLTFYLFRDELFINDKESHFSLDSFTPSATGGFYPLLWIRFLLSKEKQESFREYLFTRYRERLGVRREIAHETDKIKGVKGFFIRQRLWYTYRMKGSKNTTV